MSKDDLRQNEKERNKMIHIYVITGMSKSGKKITIYRDAPNEEKARMIGSRKLVQILSCERLVKE